MSAHRRRVVLAGALLSLAPLALLAGRARGSNCDRSYPDYCIPSPPPDLDCPQVRGAKPFRVRRPDPHNFDRDHNGWGCEPRPRRRT
jgi:micrococcal nuclease